MIQIAKTTAEVAKVQAKKGIITLSKPLVWMLLIYTGMKPQWRPKITRICQVRPTMAPAIMGLTFRTAMTNPEIRLEPKMARGPMSRKPRGMDTSSVSMGTKKNFTRSGIKRLKKRSHLAAKYTTKITGITVPV